MSTLDSTVQLDGGRTLENSGILKWGAGTLQLGVGGGATNHSASLTNTGVLSITTPGSIGAPGNGTATDTGVVIVEYRFITAAATID